MTLAAGTCWRMSASSGALDAARVDEVEAEPGGDEALLAALVAVRR